jgi:hypothetical protein
VEVTGVETRKLRQVSNLNVNCRFFDGILFREIFMKIIFAVL